MELVDAKSVSVDLIVPAVRTIKTRGGGFASLS